MPVADTAGVVTLLVVPLEAECPVTTGPFGTRPSAGLHGAPVYFALKHTFASVTYSELHLSNFSNHASITFINGALSLNPIIGSIPRILPPFFTIGKYACNDADIHFDLSASQLVLHCFIT